ncbi:MAG TPA: MTH938/NDUFAF3 family protein [Caldimonas sp.]|nr:MTH938/NDUFAF3 family protein [Caldimonas sp.]
MIGDAPLDTLGGARPMKLKADPLEGQNAIARHSAEGVIVNAREYRSSVLVPWRGEVVPWTAHDPLVVDADDFEAVAALAPELVVFGSGARIRFPRPAALRPLIDRRIGIETMDTAAACRTYNVLLAEGRSVVAALLFEAATR